jgi:hypothetical protein
MPKLDSYSSFNNLTEFLIILVGGDHVKNPYIRAKLAEVLFEMFPHAAEEEQLSLALPPPSKFFAIFESNTTALTKLVPSLIKLYIDIETTGRKGFWLFHLLNLMKGMLNSTKNFLFDGEQICHLA